MIEVRIRTLSQLFNSFDPSPFPNRDLDDAAEEFIVGSAQELPSDTDIEIRVDVCEPDLETHNNAHASEQALRQSIHNYFAGRALIAERDMKELFRIGRRHLLV